MPYCMYAILAVCQTDCMPYCMYAILSVSHTDCMPNWLYPRNTLYSDVGPAMAILSRH